MSFDSIVFLLFVVLVIGVTAFKLRSEKPERGAGSLDIVGDSSFSGDSSFQSSHHDSLHDAGCVDGSAHDGTIGDCGGFDGGGGHH